MKTIYLECNMGAAGDMLMASLYEICEEKQLFLHTMNEVFAPFGVSVSADSTRKCGVCGTHMTVLVQGAEEDTSQENLHVHLHEGGNIDEAHHADTDRHHHADGHQHHHHASYPSMLEKIHALALPDKVKEDSAAVYRLIAEAEAKVHGTTLQQIHFHEVGTLDALADVVGCAYLIYLIAPEQIFASPIHVGNGFVHCAHGILPVPAPATAELLKGIPFYTGSIASELCTPTGAALLKYYVRQFFSMPPLTVTVIGYGMGNKDFASANCIRAFLGQSEKDFPCDDSVLAISCNIDDMTGEAMGLATEIFMAAGALDVYTIPVQMKKNRPGILLTCICKPEERDKFTGLFFLHTSTRGVRYQIYDRAKLASTVETRHTAYGNIRIKKSSGYGIEKEKPEFEDLKSVVLKNDCSLSLSDIAKTMDS